MAISSPCYRFRFQSQYMPYFDLCPYNPIPYHLVKIGHGFGKPYLGFLILFRRFSFCAIFYNHQSKLFTCLQESFPDSTSGDLLCDLCARKSTPVTSGSLQCFFPTKRFKITFQSNVQI